MNTNALNNIYNYYLTTYLKDCNSPYDSHKKSELRNVCNSIAKLNKESPIYLLKNSQDTKAYAIDIKENARLLHNTIASLGGVDKHDVLNKKAAYSSDDELVSASFVGTQAVTEEIPAFEIEVESLACGQTNCGTFLSPDDKVHLRAKTYSFDLHINDTNYEFQFSIGESESNRQVQDRLCKLINHSEVGLNASVIENAEGKTALQISSTSTGILEGKEQIFSISDMKTSHAAGSVGYFGLNQTSEEARNAIFYINGAKSSAYSNHFTVDKTYDIHIKGVTAQDSPVTVGTKTDTESLSGNVTHMVDGYNQFIQGISRYSRLYEGSAKLAGEMKSILRIYQDSFDKLGISTDSEGLCSIDYEKMNVALENSDTEKLFDGIKSFTSKLLHKTEDISLDPMKYVDKKIVAYKNPGKSLFSPYHSSIYTGMMFNYYC